MTSTTSFKQQIDGEFLTLTVPMNRVERVCNKIDELLDSNKTKEARRMISKYVSTTKSKGKKEKIVMSNRKKGEVKADALKLVEANKTLERAKIIKLLQTDLGITYANARYYVVTLSGL